MGRLFSDGDFVLLTICNFVGVGECVCPLVGNICIAQKGRGVQFWSALLTIFKEKRLKLQKHVVRHQKMFCKSEKLLDLCDRYPKTIFLP